MRLLSPSLCAFLFSVIFAASVPGQSAPGRAASSSVVDLGRVVTPGKILKTKIGIPTFEVESGSGAVDPKLFVEVIYNDLELFSDFERARRQEFVEETHRRDLRANRVENLDYAEWRAVDCDFVLKGKIMVDAQQMISAECRLFDVIYGVRTFGLRFPPYPAANARALAHRISDSIIQAVFDEPGIAGTRIAFIARVPGTQNKELFLMDADGHNLRQMTSDQSITATPCWGMNATEIYFTSYKDVNPDLCGIQIGTGASWFISRRPGLNFAPNWSQKNRRIALTLARDGNSEIYTMDRSGLEPSLQRLTRDRGIDSSPSWNPDGSQIAFTSDRTGSPHIWIMNADGSNQRRLTSRGSYHDAAAWSPKGDRIAFVSRDQGRFDLYSLNLQGENLIQLTAGPGNNEDPRWAPNGRHIVFSSNRSGTYELYIIDTFQLDKPAFRLTRSSGSHSAAWSPFLSR